jgi:hypothetical protein
MLTVGKPNSCSRSADSGGRDRQTAFPPGLRAATSECGGTDATSPGQEPPTWTPAAAPASATSICVTHRRCDSRRRDRQARSGDALPMRLPASRPHAAPMGSFETPSVSSAIGTVPRTRTPPMRISAARRADRRAPGYRSPSTPRRSGHQRSARSSCRAAPPACPCCASPRWSSAQRRDPPPQTDRRG